MSKHIAVEFEPGGTVILGESRC